MIQISNITCESAVKSTGSKGCSNLMEACRRFILVKKGWKAEIATTTLDQATIDEYIQTGQWVILPAHFNFTPTIDDDVLETSNYTGEDTFVRNNPMKSIVEFTDKTYCFNQALWSLGSAKWDVLMIDFDLSGNARLFADIKDGFIKGVDGGLIQGINMTANDGSVKTKVRLRLQLSLAGTIAYNTTVRPVSTDININEIDGVNDVVIKAITTTALGFTVEVLDACNQTSLIAGLDDLQYWRVLDNLGAVVTPTGVTYVNGQYIFTGIPAGDYTVELYDTVNDRETIVVIGEYYDSDTLTVTLT